MKGQKHIFLVLFLCILMPAGLHTRTVDAPDEEYIPYITEKGDTAYLAPLRAARVYEKKPRKKGRNWRNYYRLVYNFAHVYPYALVAKDIIYDVDSTITAENLKYVKKDRYVGRIVKELFGTFEKPMKNLTVSQGQLLMRLIDRECWICPYDIIKEFKNGYAAVFWQGVAKLWGSDLKKHYDPRGVDAPTEELVRQWYNGTFEKTYYEIFWEYPPMVEVPEKYNRPNLNTKNAVKQEPPDKKKEKKDQRASSAKKKSSSKESSDKASSKRK